MLGDLLACGTYNQPVYYLQEDSPAPSPVPSPSPSPSSLPSPAVSPASPAYTVTPVTPAATSNSTTSTGNTTTSDTSDPRADLICAADTIRRAVISKTVLLGRGVHGAEAAELIYHPVSQTQSRTQVQLMEARPVTWRPCSACFISLTQDAIVAMLLLGVTHCHMLCFLWTLIIIGPDPGTLIARSHHNLPPMMITPYIIPYGMYV